jgi:hypothetical protein
MRNKKYFRENQNKIPIIEVCPKYDVLEDEGIILDNTKPNLTIDFSKFKNLDSIKKTIFNFYFLGQPKIRLDETYELISVFSSENLGDIFYLNEDIYESDVETILRLFQQTTNSLLSWKSLLEATEKIKGNKYELFELEEVYETYNGYYVSPVDYLRNNGIYTIESGSGFLFFDSFDK